MNTKYLLVAGVIILAVSVLLVATKPRNDYFNDPAHFDNGYYVGPKDQTRIPYNNGFYAGPYNPNLPVINPKAK